MDSIALENCLYQLEQKEPQTAQKVAAALAANSHPVAEEVVNLITQTLLRALDQTPVLATSATEGLIALLADNHTDAIAVYAQHVTEAGRQGPALAHLMARHLPAVLLANDTRLLKLFDRTVGRLHQIGTYTLTPTLKALAQILDQNDIKGAHAYLTLLNIAATHSMTYNRCVRFCHVIPKGMARLDTEKRHWQIDQAARAMKCDLDLGDAFLEGMQNGLYRLNAQTLERFVTFGLDQWRIQPRRGISAMALTARESVIFLRQLSTNTTLQNSRREISRYLRARLGRAVPIRTMDRCPQGTGVGRFTQSCSDGTTLYLPAEINLYPEYEKNHAHLLMLAKLEAGLLEFGTFDFDRDLFLKKGKLRDDSPFCPNHEDFFNSDLEWFTASFPDPLIAQNLLTLFEHARIRLLTRHRYPGLHRRITPFLTNTMQSILAQNGDPLHQLYAHLAIGMQEVPLPHWKQAISRDYKAQIGLEAAIEEVALFITTRYAFIRRHCKEKSTLLETPYGRGVFPQLHDRAMSVIIKTRSIQTRPWQPGPEQPKHQSARTKTANTARTSSRSATASGSDQPGITQHYFQYPEWRADIDDYLPGHTTVAEQNSALGEVAFYSATLDHHRPLVRYVRHAFEQMRPQKLNVLRPWKDGDAFDLTQLTEYAINRRLQRTLPERLYIKRVKSDRSVAVQLLVDLSRSTANPSRNSHRSVLEIEKEALVLFCEALHTLGDAFAIAGFSGKGRQQVYFRHVKKFDEPLNETIFQRIGALVPIQATRMGAAVRHAVFRLKEQPAKVRLLIVLGDGFPNDLDYKREIAIADTRKAIQHSVANNVHVHGITVNMAADPQLNALYGPRHSVITDVRDLPAKLLHIYRQLTL